MQNVLVIDVGGTHVKLLATGQAEARKFESGSDLTPQEMVAKITQALGTDWEYDAISIGYPGPVKNNRPVEDPINLGPGWVDFDYEAEFGHPVRMINDAAMQALGSYHDGHMLFLGIGTGLGTTLIVDGVIIPLEVGHLPYRNETFEDFVGARGMERLGKKKWRKRVRDVVARLRAAFLPDYIVLGGGNVKFLDTLPEGCEAGKNANAFAGGFRLWPEIPAPAEA